MAEIDNECGESFSWYAVSSEKRVAFINTDTDVTNATDWAINLKWRNLIYETRIRFLLSRSVLVKRRLGEKPNLFFRRNHHVNPRIYERSWWI